MQRLDQDVAGKRIPHLFQITQAGNPSGVSPSCTEQDEKDKRVRL